MPSDADYTWLGTLQKSREYLDAARVLHHHVTNQGDLLSEPTYLLYHQSVELMLKAYLQACGVTKNMLLKLNHDTANIVDAFEEYGGSLDADSLDTFRQLKSHGGVVDVRYYKTGWIRRFRGQVLEKITCCAFCKIADQARQKNGMKNSVGFENLKVFGPIENGQGRRS